MADTNVSPAGSGSLTRTFVAVSRPALLTVTLKVTLLPTFGVPLLTVLATDRSATCGEGVALAWSSSAGLLLPGVESGSGWSEALTWAVLVYGPAGPTVATTCRVALAPLAIVPTVQTP